MALETANYINDLTITNPTASDPKSQGDDHIRMLKAVLKECFAGFTGAVIITATETGTADAHVLNPATALIAYTTGLLLLYRPVNAGTGALTVNVSALGAKNVKTLLGADPTTGDIVANQPLLLCYDGTNFVIIAGSEQLLRTGNQVITGNWSITGNWTLTGDLSVSGSLTGPSMTAKANKAGETYAGTHDFTAATLNTATPSTGSNAANKTYVDGVAMTAALPGQSALTVGMVPISGKTTVGVAEWGNITVNGGASTTNPMSSDLTLTATSNRVQVVYPTGPGFKIILPDATTMTTSKGSQTLIAINRGDYPVRIVTNGSVDTIAIVEGWQAAGTTLEDASTATGTWKAHNLSYDGMGLRQMYAGSAVQVAAKAINAAQGRMAVASLGNNKFVMAYSDSTNSLGRCLVVDVSGTTPTYGTEVSFHTTTNPTFISICALSSTQAIVCYQDGSGANGVSKTINISGSTISSVGAAFNFNAGSVNFTNVQTISSTTAMVLYNDTSNNLSTKVLTVSGTTITGGSAGPVVAATANSYQNIAVLSATTAVILYTTASTNLVYMVQNMAGNVITPGTAAALMSSVTPSEITLASLKDGSRFIYSYVTGTSLKIATASVSSTTATPYTETTFRTGAVTNLIMTSINNRKVAMSLTTPASMTEAWVLTVEAGGYEVTGVADVKASLPITTQSASSFNQTLAVTPNGKLFSGYRLTGTTFPNGTVVEVLG